MADQQGQSGILLTCDPEIKQYLLHVNASLPPGQRFVLRDLGEKNLFITKKAEAMVRQKMEDLLNEITFQAPATR